uniref:Uncharacterized protein n=1 Tax=viral metagenome TaxID=1070528 RepID=A0A6C0E8F9_9ZZZZ
MKKMKKTGITFRRGLKTQKIKLKLNTILL